MSANVKYSEDQRRLIRPDYSDLTFELCDLGCLEALPPTVLLGVGHMTRACDLLPTYELKMT